MKLVKTLALACAFALSFSGSIASAQSRNPEYDSVVKKVENMVSDSEIRDMARRYGLDVINVTWEDTGRDLGSSMGPNISDMTIQVRHGSTERPAMTCMPVIRYPNFEDKTGDIPLGKFYIRTGNEKGKDLITTPLGALLEDPRGFMSDKASWAGTGTMFLAQRDSQLLVSAQACFLPIPKQGEATFNPVLFNYQSMAGSPAVLALLVTREGTSMTIIDNTRDAVSGGSGSGQRLFFNSNGQKASLTGKRLSDFAATPEPAPTEPGQRPTAPKVGANQGLNMVMLVQIPLKVPPRLRSLAVDEMSDMAPGAAMYDSALEKSKSNVEEAVIGHGELEGPFVEIANLDIQRDPQFPVRVTVQFYKATDNGVVSEEDMKQIKEQIDNVYKDATYVGSLVVPADPNRVRLTDWKPTKPLL